VPRIPGSSLSRNDSAAIATTRRATGSRFSRPQAEQQSGLSSSSLSAPLGGAGTLRREVQC
jgi:hypothetical protein